MVSNRHFILKWNEEFPLDYWWRKKYNVPFNSQQHREISYIDIFYEWLEEKIYEESVKQLGENEKAIKQYNDTGEWFNDIVDKEKEDEMIDLFDKMDISAFNG